MAEYEKLEDSKTHFTGPIAGQLYIRFLKCTYRDISLRSLSSTRAEDVIEGLKGNGNPQPIRRFVS
jgi:hypothetical protein